MGVQTNWRTNTQPQRHKEWLWYTNETEKMSQSSAAIKQISVGAIRKRPKESHILNESQNEHGGKQSVHRDWEEEEEKNQRTITT